MNFKCFICNVCKAIITVVFCAFGLFILGCIAILVMAIKEGEAIYAGISVVFGGVCLLVCLLLIWVWLKLDKVIEKNSPSHSSYRSSSSSSWSSSYDYKPSQSHGSGYDDVIAAASAQEMSRVTKTYGKDWTGYDPEAPQPWDKPYDPEAPQPWDTNWLDC